MALKPAFNSILNQKCTIVNEKFSILDNSTVLYTTNSKWAVNFKDGHSTLEDPEAIMITFKKIEGKWKVTYFVDSFAQNIVPGASSKELNQVELVKQLLGPWKVNLGKDTTLFWEAKPFGLGLECYYKTVAKDKMLMEAKQLFGYDKKIDKFVATNMVKGMDVEIWVLWFTSKSKYEITYYSDLFNPDNPSFKIDGVINSPNEYSETIILNGKPAGTYKYMRIK